jgi:hypothetical protein
LGVLQTFSELRDELRSNLKLGSTTTEVAHAGMALNKALRQMHISPGHKFPWAERRQVLITHAPYVTGTVSITAATSRLAVIGSGTAWNTAVVGFGFNNVRAGGKIIFTGNEIYTVDAVASDTALTLQSRYTGDDLSGSAYRYFEDEYTLAADFLRFVDLSLFSSDAKIPLLGRSEFRNRIIRNDLTSKPAAATHIQVGFATTTAPQHRIALTPAPDDEYSLPYWYVTSNLAVSSIGAEQAAMTADGDEPIVPILYREGLLFYAQSVYYRDYKDDIDRSQLAMGQFTEMMLRFANENTQDKPRFVMGCGRGGKLDPRFDTGNRFDTLRDRWR